LPPGRRSGRHLYFAYGSNLDLEQMRDRCPGAEPLGVARLGGQKLTFAGSSLGWGGGVATLVPARRRTVPGLVYELTDDDLARLDLYEGHPFVYERRSVRVDLEGRRVRAITYVRPATRRALPSTPYLTKIARAYLRLGFDIAHIRKAFQ
jgi:gamma-glutamylcyclotransferase (GGCT)/AIG2-like uncharacterized protein YtfP